ncbi:hypothetical protein [Streptomyces decoyicus]
MSKIENPEFEAEWATAEEFEDSLGLSPARIDEWLLSHGLTQLPTGEAGEEGLVRWRLPAAWAQLTQLLNASQIANLLGYKRLGPVYQDGFLPDPDEYEVPSEKSRSKMRWRLITIIRWDLNRPGKGRRAGSARTLKKLPDASWEGEPERLVFGPEVAALLGYNSMESFSSSLNQGNLPELTETQPVEAEDENGRLRKAYPLSAVREVGKRKGRYPAKLSDPGDELWDSTRVAAELGYSGPSALNNAIKHGRLPQLDEPDDFATGGRGRPKKLYKAGRVKKIADSK